MAVFISFCRRGLSFHQRVTLKFTTRSTLDILTITPLLFSDTYNSGKDSYGGEFLYNEVQQQQRPFNGL